MKQVVQNLKTGEIIIDSVPTPSIKERFVFVENKSSLISVGTEKSTINMGKASLLGKAKTRPDLVKQVLQNINKEGLLQTYNKVKTKLDSPKALGYCSSGIVKSSLDSNGEFKPGDRVACAGQDYAAHAEFISVPQNLVVKIPENVSYEEASFCTVGAIALQGVRQANPKIGENICVIGLGLIGQLTCQLLNANGCNVFGIDLNDQMISIAQKFSNIQSKNRKDRNLISTLQKFTNGELFDKVIIAADTASNDPLILASDILRKKGIIIIVGSVKLYFPREPNFYSKELELKMSCSYGPGRYDVNYEQYGNDYPYEYVRWTEGRNMEAFLKIISSGRMNIKPLISHQFNIEDAISAYELILGENQESYLGVIIRYTDIEKNDKSTIKITDKEIISQESIKIGFLGAGNFAQSYLIPHIKGLGSLLKVVTNSGITAKNVAKKFNFQMASTNSNELITQEDIDTIFITTRHDSHSKFVIDAMKANKNIFIEKPLTLNQNEIFEIQKYSENYNKLIMVGYNRRFSPLIKEIKNKIGSNKSPLVINYNVNAGFIDKNHWIQNQEGGGRIIGEVCHFIDLMQYLTGSEPTSVFAQSLKTNDKSQIDYDNISINIAFNNGSIGNIIYNSNGNNKMPKELINISCEGNSYEINDFKKAIIYSGKKIKNLKSSSKGHKEEVQAFLNSVKIGKKSPIALQDILLTSLTTFKILDSLYTGLPQEISL